MSSRNPPLAWLAALPLLAAVACERGPTLDPALADGPPPSASTLVDDELADAGAWYFRRNCVACHSLGGGALVGPDLAGVTERRSLVWIEAIVRRPDSMLIHDAEARRLLRDYQVPMPDRGLDGARVRAILEFLRRADRGPSAAGTPHLDTPDTTRAP
jgi:mono/diheme cytochrome c family protein